MSSSAYDALLSRLGSAFLRDFFRGLADGPFPAEVEVFVHFLTTAPGVELSAPVRAQYPAQITIMLRARSLGSPIEVEDDAFAVHLSLTGGDERVRVPFAAILGIVDERAGMALQFPVIRMPGAESDDEAGGGAGATGDGAASAGGQAPPAASNVVPWNRPRRTT